jgi:outer membrane protein assembly factor BamB
MCQLRSVPRVVSVAVIIWLAPMMCVRSLARADDPQSGITHGFLATGAETYIRDGKGTITWRYPDSTRDGWLLPSGNILLAVSKSKTHPGGGVVEIQKDGKIVFEYKGTQAEVNTAQAIDGQRILISEAGDKPRLLEVNRNGRILAEVPLKAQIKDHHLQTRMARKLANGNFLVPQLLDKVVREYTPAGAIIWEAKTPNMPFTAIRLDNGHTVIGCTHGNMVVEVDANGETVWQLTNEDLPGPLIKDACGVQRLANGNTVITSYQAGAGDVKLLEVTPAKKLVWIYRDTKNHGIHHFQILDTNGKLTDGIPRR